jgi:uncharacterized protein YukE
MTARIEELEREAAQLRAENERLKTELANHKKAIDNLTDIADGYLKERDQLKAALRECVEALEHCYDVTDFPADGDTPQDRAIAKAKELLK